MAGATDSRRRSSGGGLPRPRTGSSATSRSGGQRALVVAGVLVLLAVAYVLYRRHSSASSSTLDTSGTPGPGMNGSAGPGMNGSGAQEPNGGAASVPGNLPAQLVDQPDVTQQQVQQFDTSNPTAPTMISYGGPPQPGPLQTVTTNGQTFTQSAPGSDYFVPGSAGGPVDPGNITGHGHVGD